MKQKFDFDLTVAELRRLRAVSDQENFPKWLDDFFLPKLRKAYPSLTDEDEERLVKEVNQP